MGYALIDSAINEWVSKNRLHLYTSYREEEVRSVEIVSERGDRFQIWIDPPKAEIVGVHVWDYKRRRVDLEGNLTTLPATLDVAHETVMRWTGDREQAKKI